MNTANETNTTSMHDRAAAIAALMPGWSLGETSHTIASDAWARITHTSGAELSLSLKAWPKPERIHISGVWPRRMPNSQWGEFMPRDSAPYSINVSLTKTPAQIARDIARRLEGPFLAEYAVQAERMRATLAAEGGAEKDAKRIAASIGEQASKGAAGTYTIWLSNLFNDERRGRGDLKVSPATDGEPAHVDLELHGITPDEAVLILKLLHGGLEGTAVAALVRTKEPSR